MRTAMRGLLLVDGFPRNATGGPGASHLDGWALLPPAPAGGATHERQVPQAHQHGDDRRHLAARQPVGRRSDDVLVLAEEVLEDALAAVPRTENGDEEAVVAAPVAPKPQQHGDQ